VIKPENTQEKKGNQNFQENTWPKKGRGMRGMKGKKHQKCPKKVKLTHYVLTQLAKPPS